MARLAEPRTENSKRSSGGKYCRFLMEQHHFLFLQAVLGGISRY